MVSTDSRMVTTTHLVAKGASLSYRAAKSTVVLAPGIVMPHVQPSEASDTKVTNSTIAFMHPEEPVSFDDSDPEKYGKIFFTLAVKDVDDHFQCMVKIVNMLNNPEIMNALMDAHGPEDLLALQEKYGDIINAAL